MECKECGEQLEVGSMSIHMMNRYGKAVGQRRQWKTMTENRVPQEYRMSFPEKGGVRRCPVEGCPGKLATRTSMWLHFVHRHDLDTVVMLEEGNFPHPRCARFDIQVPRRALNERHPGTAQCAKGAERKIRRLAETETREKSEWAFVAYWAPIKLVTEFKYLGRILTAIDDDWPAVVGNHRKAKQSWGRLAKVLSREGADPKVSWKFYIAVTKAVLLLGSETWVLTARMENSLDSFQSRVAQNLTGRQLRLRKGVKDRTWYYPSLAGAMKEVGIVRIRTSILRRQNTVAQFIVTRPILDLCEKTTRRPGAWVAWR